MISSIFFRKNLAMLDQTTFQGSSAFAQLRHSSDKLILVEVGAPHCGSCATLKPVLEQLAINHQGSFHLVEVDMTEDPELAVELGVRSVPTVVLFKGDRLILIATSSLR
jgi:thioredoxin-like negative regulator of GroEL